MRNKYKYLAKNTLLFTISSFGSKILVFFLVPLYTSVLTTAEYGVADIISTSASLLTYVFTLDIASSVLRFAIEQKENQYRFLAYGIRVLMAGSTIFAAVLFGIYYLRAIQWENYCYFFLFLNYFVLALNALLSNYLRAIDRVKEVAVSGIIMTMATIGTNIVLLLFLKMGLLGYLIAVSFGSLASSAYCLIVIRQPMSRLLFDCCEKKVRREMRQYSIPLIFNGVAWGLNNSLDKYIVIWMSGMAENGILSVAYKIPTLLTTFHIIFAQAWNLSAIKEFDKEDKDGFFSNTYVTYNAALVIVCSGLILLNIPIAKMLFAKDFFAAWQYSSVLLLSSLFSALSGILGSVFAAVKDSKVFAISTVTAFIINAILNVVLIHYMGTIGAAIATAVSFFVVWLIRFIYTRKYINWKINIKKDMVAYLLLCAQIVLEHMSKHGYVGQLIILLLLIFMYKDKLYVFYSVAKKVVTPKHLNR